MAILSFCYSVMLNLVQHLYQEILKQVQDDNKESETSSD
jgi:ATP/ADP translocase